MVKEGSEGRVLEKHEGVGEVEGIGGGGEKGRKKKKLDCSFLMIIW